MREYFKDQPILTGSIYHEIRPIDRAITTFLKELHNFMDSSIRIEYNPINMKYSINVAEYDYKFEITEEDLKRKISSEDSIIDFIKEIGEKIEEHELNKILPKY